MSHRVNRFNACSKYNLAMLHHALLKAIIDITGHIW